MCLRYIITSNRFNNTILCVLQPTARIIAVESCATLLSRDLKSNLFNLFASWGGPLTKPLGIAYHAAGTNCAEESKLQFGAFWVCVMAAANAKGRVCEGLF